MENRNDEFRILAIQTTLLLRVRVAQHDQSGTNKDKPHLRIKVW